jgi:hypothetical protein
VAFASSPVKAAADNHDDDWDSDHDDTDHAESDSLFLWDEESSLLDALMNKP